MFFLPIFIFFDFLEEVEIDLLFRRIFFCCPRSSISINQSFVEDNVDIFPPKLIKTFLISCD